MPDKKISQLNAASLPLAGTETLPIVQSSSTVKVASNDLTVKNIRSNATTGILQVVGPAAAATRVMTTPDANFSAARIDAAQSFTGDQTLADGNLIIGTAGKGVDFSASSHTAGMTSELLDDYEEGTHTVSITCSIGGTISLAGDANKLRYTKIGDTVHVCGFLYITGVSSPNGSISISLPFTAGSGNAYFSAPSLDVLNVVSANVADFIGRIGDNTAVLSIVLGNATSGQPTSANQMQATSQIRLSVTYKTA